MTMQGWCTNSTSSLQPLQRGAVPRIDMGRSAVTAVAAVGLGSASLKRNHSHPGIFDVRHRLGVLGDERFPQEEGRHPRMPRNRPSEMDSRVGKLGAQLTEDPRDLDDPRRQGPGPGTSRPGPTAFAFSGHPKPKSLHGHRDEQRAFESQRHAVPVGDVVHDSGNQVDDLGPSTVTRNCGLIQFGRAQPNFRSARSRCRRSR